MFVQNKTCKYILENPQRQLCNIREMEMNNNCNNGKCAVNDDTTCYNCMIPIISPTSPKEGRKIVFTNENERPHNKYQIESESEELIEQKNEDIDQLKSTIKRKSEKKDKKKLKKNCKEQSNSESESGREILSSILKYFKSDKYLPGNKFQSTFIDKNVDRTKKKNLKKKLQKRLKNIEKEFEKLTGKKVLKMQGRKKNTLHILKL